MAVLRARGVNSMSESGLQKLSFIMLVVLIFYVSASAVGS